MEGGAMESYKEYVRKIENKCKDEIRTEYDRFLKAVSVLALIGGGILIVAAEGLNWIFSWKIDIRALVIMVFVIYATSFVATLWRVRELRFRALLRGELGWPIEQLRADLIETLSEIKGDLGTLDSVERKVEWLREEIRDVLKEIKSDLGKLDSIERKVEWLRGEIRDDLKHEIEMHEIRTSG
jgi:tetrahydromethanopterin S-methyltransferase subunit G